MKNRDFGVDLFAVESAVGSQRDEGFTVAAMVVEAVTTEHKFREDLACVEDIVVYQPDIDTFMHTNRCAIELGGRSIFFVRHDDGFGKTPVGRILTFGKPNQTTMTLKIGAP